MGVVYLSIITTFETSRYCKCWIVCFYNTTVAFPTILFVKNEIDEIPYKITSKNNPDVVEGCIKVKS